MMPRPQSLLRVDHQQIYTEAERQERAPDEGLRKDQRQASVLILEAAVSAYLGVEGVVEVGPRIGSMMMIYCLLLWRRATSIPLQNQETPALLAEGEREQLEGIKGKTWLMLDEWQRHLQKTRTIERSNRAVGFLFSMALSKLAGSDHGSGTGGLDSCSWLNICFCRIVLTRQRHCLYERFSAMHDYNTLLGGSIL
jgi:hypothetical protein